jgi:hypothetical protein
MGETDRATQGALGEAGKDVTHPRSRCR